MAVKSNDLRDSTTAITRKVQILKQTIERRFPPDEVVDFLLEDLEVDLKLLLSQMKRP